LYDYISSYQDTIIKYITKFYLFSLFLRFILSLPDSFQLFIVGRSALSENYLFMTNGGQNIEVTFMAFLTMMQKNKFMFYLLFFITIVFSTLYESRVGIILSLFSLIFFYYHKLNLLKLFIGILIPFTFIITILFTQYQDTDFVKRFTNINQELEYGEKGIGRIGFYIGGICSLFFQC